MKDLKNRWERELNANIPGLSEDVKNAPIPKPFPNARKKDPFSSFVSAAANWFAVHRTRKIAVFAVCMACVMTLCIVLPVALQKPSGVGAEVIAVEINPEALFTVAKSGEITAVVATNEDADVILADEKRVKEIEGKTAEEGIRIFVDYAAQLGYLDLNATLENPDAVRVSACTQKGRLQEVKQTLNGYFREKGAYVAVVENYTTASEMAARLGKAADSLSALMERAEAASTLYSERMAEDKDLSELQAIYRENVSLEDVREEFKSILEENVHTIERNIADLEEIQAQHETIAYHTDNPVSLGFVGVDYWTLRYCNKEAEYTEAFRAEIEKMDGLLSAYEAEYGVRIAGRSDMQELMEDCEALPLEELAAALLEFTLDVFTKHFSALVEHLENVGVDMSGIKKMYELPETLAEYAEKTAIHMRYRFDALVDANCDVYGEVREEITAQDHESCMERLIELIEEYGSLEAYWASRKNP